jgi:para-nitrobenzyl esterase
MTQRLLAKLEIATGELSRLQTLPLEQIMLAYFNVFRETGGYGVLGILQGFAPVVDGHILPRHPFHHSSPTVSADVPLLIGTTRTEMTLNTLLGDADADKMDEHTLNEQVAGLFGSDAERVLAAYRAAHPSMSPWELYAVITSDWPTRLYSIWIAEAKAKLGRASVFMYRTDWQTPVAGGRLMSPHAIDISFVLDDTPYTGSFDGGGRAVKRISHRMSEAWLAFARHGDPNTPALPKWPSYELEARRATMLFGNECRVTNDPDGADRRALDAILAGR